MHVKRPLKRIHEGILRLLNDVSIQDMLQDAEAEPVVSMPRSSSLVALQGTTKSLESHGSLRK